MKENENGFVEIMCPECLSWVSMLEGETKKCPFCETVLDIDAIIFFEGCVEEAKKRKGIFGWELEKVILENTGRL